EADEKKIAVQEKPPFDSAILVSRSVLLNDAEFLDSDRWMLRRIIAEPPPPQHRPDSAEASENPEARTPADGSHEGDCQRGSQPLVISKIAYASVNALKTHPI